MKLIKDLGRRVVKGRGRRFGLYECPECLNVVELRSDTVTRHSKIHDYPQLCKPCKAKHSAKVRTRHGDCVGGGRTKLARVWSNMKQRAKGIGQYSQYAGKGIYDGWVTDYEAFKTWALANGYRDNLTIDRVDNSKGYYPDNCRWVTNEVNASKDNTRASYTTNKGVKLSYENVAECITLRDSGMTHKAIADKFGVARTTVGAILSKYSRVDN